MGIAPLLHPRHPGCSSLMTWGNDPDRQGCAPATTVPDRGRPGCGAATAARRSHAPERNPSSPRPQYFLNRR